MKRFICYLYEYQEGRRIRNIGFCKVETSEEGSTVSIHGKGWGADTPRKLALYLFWREKGKCFGVYQGELNNISPALNYRLAYTKDDMGSKKRYDQVEGIILCGDRGPRYAATWTDEMVDIGKMEAVEKEEEETLNVPEVALQNEEQEDAVPGESAEEMPEEENNPKQSMGEAVESEENLIEVQDEPENMEEAFDGEEEKEQEKPELSEQECAGECRFRCSKIQRQDISKLIRREWQLANNSFLLHGYYNYHHLVFLWEGETMYLGVPGVFSEKEQRAARAFGFPGFVNYDEGMIELSEEDKEEETDFGYWCRQVHQIRV